MSHRKASIPLVILLFMGLVAWPLALGDETQTAHITRTHDDGFTTESGIGIDSTLIHILDPNMDIRAHLLFLDIEINTWESLDNATLRLTSASTLPFDADSSVTVYGMAQADIQGLSGVAILSPGEIMSMPLTLAFVNVNTSLFYGGATIDINVTEIVRELHENPHWDGHGLAGDIDGDAMGFMILGAEDEIRYFYDFRGDPARSADLIINWGHSPPGPGPYASLNSSYRGDLIWETPGITNPNRTGLGSDIDWGVLNVTDLTEQDSGADIVRNNASWTTVTTMPKSVIASLYNDTGGANVNTFFARFSVNVTAVNNAIAGNDPIPGFMGMSTVIPTGANGLAYGVAGEWIGLINQVNVDDARWRIFVHDRSGVADATGGGSTWFDETTQDMLYIEAMINATGGFVVYSIYNDALYTDLNQTRSMAITLATAPFRYTQILASMGQAGASWASFEYHTFLTPVVLGNSTWTVTDENGTIKCTGLDDYEDALICVDDSLGGPHPEEPNPPGQEWPTEGPFTRFRTRAYIFVLGFFCVWGPVWFFAWKRPSAYYLFVGALIIITGLGLMLHVTTI